MSVSVIVINPTAGLSDYKPLASSPGQVASSKTDKVPSVDITTNIASIALDFAKQYPSEHYIPAALGRSPLFFLEVLTALRRDPGDYLHISGSKFQDYQTNPDYQEVFKHLDHIIADDLEVFEKWLSTTKLDPDFANAVRKNLLAYKRYLTQKEMSPDSIIQRAENGKRTVLVDGISMGASITFIAAFLQAWAKEQGKEKELGHSLVFHGFEFIHSNDSNDWTTAIQNMGFECNYTISPYFIALMADDGYGMGFHFPHQEMDRIMQQKPCLGTREKIAQAFGERMGQLRTLIVDYLESAGFLK